MGWIKILYKQGFSQIKISKLAKANVSFMHLTILAMGRKMTAQILFYQKKTDT